MANNKQKGQKKKRVKKSKNQANGNQTQSQVARSNTVSKKRRSRVKFQGMDGVMSSERDFVQLALDPCAGPLTVSPFGTSGNAYIWRLNYRSVHASNAAGHLMAGLYPLGVHNGGGSVSANFPQCVQIWNGASLTDNSTPTSSSASTVPGLMALQGLAAQLRVTAGCIKLNYIGPASTAQGEMWAWEGQGDENLASVASSQLMVTRATPQWYIMNGGVASITQGVQSRLNYAKAPDVQCNFADIAVTRADVYCPWATVGVSGGPPTTNYVVEVTLIVEWTPALSQGVPAPDAKLRAPGAAERVANVIKTVAPLLVSVGTAPIGGYAGAFGKAVKFGSAVYSALKA